MIEKIILDYLNSKGVKTYMEEQDKMPKEFILIEKTGSGENDFIKNSTIVIQSFSDSLYKTSLLNEKVKTLMFNITESVDIVSCKLNSDYNYPDPEKKRYRYQAVFDIVHY